MGIILNRRRVMGVGGSQGQFIQFADPTVKALCVAAFGGADGGTLPTGTSYRVNGVKVTGVEGEITYEQAASILRMPSYSQENTFFNRGTLTSFDELQYFTSLMAPYFQQTSFSGSVTLPNIIDVMNYVSVFRSSKIGSFHIPPLAAKSIWGDSCCIGAVITNVYFDDINDWYDSTLVANIASSPVASAQHIYVNGIDTTAFSVPEGKTTIGAQLASPAVRSIILPSTLTTIGTDAFRDTQMQTLTIPSGVTSLGGYILYNTTLPEIIFTSAVPPTATSTTWLTTNKLGTIYVPDGSVEDYKAANNWSNVASKIKSINERP